VIMRLAMAVLVLFGLGVPVQAQQRLLYSSPSPGTVRLPDYVAKDFGLFDQYGLNVELIMIVGGSRGMQALIGGSTQFASMAAMAPVSVMLAGGDVVIVGGVVNKNLFKIASQKHIRNPSDLKGKRIGVFNFGGSHEFGVLMALNEWNIPRQSVTLIPGGGREALFAGLETGHFDAIILGNDTAALASKRGFNILADVGEIVPEFPDRLVIVRRSYLEKDRGAVKRFFQALSEATWLISNGHEKQRVVAALARHMKTDQARAEENYSIYQRAFSLPPRVRQKGMQAVMEIMQQQSGKPKADFDFNRFVDNSVIDELEKEGFFERINRTYANK
jgi:ABC-type nitrate/sulfonate/bicarbonate transport system substrate-binding protein